MTSTPERIWATPIDAALDGGTYCNAADRPTAPNHDARLYISDDLVPTDAQVMSHPKVRALVEAAKPYISPFQTADYGRQLRQYEALCAALRDLERGEK